MITAIDFYDKGQVLPRCGTCLDWLAHIGVSVQNGRCAATWRDGDNPTSVAVTADQWYDHVTQEGGGLIELVQVTQLSGIRDARTDPGYFNQTLATLAEWAGVPPIQRRGVVAGSGFDPVAELTAAGYREVKRYNYCDDAGNVIYFNARFEHPEKKKEFRQGTPDGKWTLKGIEPLLYRWNDSARAASWCVVVEGEKDVDTLISWGVPATNGRVASKWSHVTVDRFAGKDVVIIADNDEAGLLKAQVAASRLKGVAKSIRVGTLSTQPKGDVTDWAQREGGNAEKLFSWVAALPLANLSGDEYNEQRAVAKEANRYPFSNFINIKIKNEHGKEKTEKKPRHINEMVSDVHKRFLGFPRVIGRSCLFDHDQDSGEIHEIHNADQLIAWMDAKSNKSSSFTRGDNFRSAGQLLERLICEGITYQAVSMVPNWPQRNDVFYAHGRLPKPSENYQVFERFVDMFSPASPAYRTVLKAFIAAPLWYINGIPRPGWIIDSEDGAGTGKTTIVEFVSRLYSNVPVRTNKNELTKKTDELIKRVISAAGRDKRIMLIDNVTGQFSCSELADMMTCEAVSGKAPYGRGEESRPNDIVYVLTANSATVDNDIADRCYFIYVKRPEWSNEWRLKVIQYINENRMQIIADIIGMLETGAHREPRTRFPEFCSQILSPICRTDEEYASALDAIEDAKASSNVEDEQAKTIEDEFQSRLIDAGFEPGTQYIFIRTDVVKQWMEDIFRGEIVGHPSQYIRNLAKNGLTERFNVKPNIYPHAGPQRRRGIMWKPENPVSDTVHIAGLSGRKIVKIIQ